MKFFKKSSISWAGLLALTLVFATSCNPNDAKPKGTYFDIYLDFWNTTGKTPEVRFDELKTSREIKIDFDKTFEGRTEGSSFTKVEIDNFRIVDANSNNFNIENITAYELREGEWKKDIEFTMSFDQSEDISVVLVLDRSKSLGQDFVNIQTYAKDFIDQIFTDRPVVQMGVVDFADDVQSYPLTTDKEKLKSYVDGLEQGNFTTLYDAMDLGIDMLRDSDSQSKVLFVFTDGSDNNSSPNVDKEYLLNRIKPQKNSTGITSFAIGLSGDGGVDQSILSDLSGNGGTASFPKTISQAKDVFKKFSKVISNVYSLEYLRNQQVIPRNTPRKLKFEIQTVQ